MKDAGLIVTGRSRVWGPAIGLALLAGLAGCHAAPVQPSSAAPTQASHPPASSPSPAPSGTVWLAVLRRAPAPDALDAATARLGPLLGGALVVGPADCFSALPSGGGGYVLGVVAPSRAELEPLVGRTGIEPSLIVRTRSVCVD